MSERTLKERMETRKENYLLRLDTHIDMFNQSLSRNAPVLSQLVSALTVGYALYEGVSKWIGAPIWAAVMVGIVAAGAIETVGFMAVDERDKAEAHNRHMTDDVSKVDTNKSHDYVNATFWITLSIVGVIEALPALVGAFWGTMEVGGVLFRCSLLVFPLLSRLGANLYAFRSVRLAAESEVASKLMDAKNKAEKLDAEDHEFEKMKRQADLEAYKAKLLQDADIERQRALTDLRIKEQKAVIKLSENEHKKISTSGRSVEENFPESIQKVSGESVGRELVLYYKANPGAKLEDAAQHVGWSVPAISKEVSSLVDIGVFHAEKQGRRKVITVNGNHEQFLAGEL